MNRRLTRREMTQKDDFVTGVERAATWLEGHWKTVAIAVAGVLGVLIAGGSIYTWIGVRANQADTMLGQAMITLQAPLLAEGQLVGLDGGQGYPSAAERDQAAMSQLDGVVDSYPMSRAATLASYMRGATLLRLERPAEAREALVEFSGDNQSSVLLPLAQRALSRAELALGNADEAVRILEDLVANPTPLLPVDAALMDLGHTQEAAHRLPEAAATYQRLVKEYPQSVFTNEAGQAFARLNAAGISPPA